MSVDREKQYMTQTETDIAFLLAEATDEVEIGIAPVQAVMRGGRRRRARRWAMAAATAVVVLGGSAGATLAFAGLPGEHRAPVAVKPTSPEARHVYEPQITELSRGVYHGKEWHVSVEVWGAPRDKAEAVRQRHAMSALGIEPAVDKPAELVGKISHFVTRANGGGRPQQLMFDSVGTPDRFTGTDLQSMATRFTPDGASSGQLVVGEVATTALEVTCRWKDGTSTVARVATGRTPGDPASAIRSAAGYPWAKWFVCVSPAGKTLKEADTTKWAGR
ncbi:hypothetical protein ACFXDH_07940 [Streptomyces sp. NPDC059467]|uniref:hypothetical protein n=1 Tax=Streptomyces sp. NPDC059467 TaxID=3346844 RepID=UPI0036AF43F8